MWGREFDEGYVRKKIIDFSLEEKIILAGFNDYLDTFWNLCDLNLFLSLNDGFGLPIIEGYMNGIPCVTFSDLDASNDLYFPEAMMMIKDRRTESIVQTVYKALNYKWKTMDIIKVGNRFSLCEMAKSYQKWYTSINGGRLYEQKI